MKNEPLSERTAYELIGRAIIDCQAFEGMFVLFSRLAIAQGDVSKFEELQPISYQSFKQPTASALKEICSKTGISEDFKDRVLQLVESRNRIAHRAAAEFHWPPNAANSNQFVTLCKFVSDEAEALALLVYRFILAWTAKYPEFSDLTTTHMHDFRVTRDDLMGAAKAIRGA